MTVLAKSVVIKFDYRAIWMCSNVISKAASFFRPKPTLLVVVCSSFTSVHQ